MSCQQQLIQEDPYIFTDTISNSANFMHEHNSQTKYVPLNRQTIYNRQFRQHEPTITSSTDLNSRKSSSPKIIISPSSLKERKNGLHNNGTITTKSITPRTSPKLFKTQLAADDYTNVQIKYEVDDEVLATPAQKNHSIASQSVSPKELLRLNNHVTGGKCENENDISGIITASTATTTGIKQELLEEITGKAREFEDEISYDIKVREKYKKNYQRKNNRISTTSATKSVTIEPISNIPRLIQLEWTVINRNFFENLQRNEQPMTRDERLKVKKSYLRNVLDRLEGSREVWRENRETSKRNFVKTCKLLKAMNREKEEMFKRSVKKCFMRECDDEAIAMSDYCSKHILTCEKEQFLIRQCCFLHNDGLQCRVPVYDVMATVAVCNDHLNAPPNQLVNGSKSNNYLNGSISIDSMKPKKPQIQRKRNKTNGPMIRPVKKTASGKPGRKKRIPASPIKFSPLSSSGGNITHHRPTMIIHPNDIHKKTTTKTTSMSLGTASNLLPLKMENLLESNHQFIHHNSGNLLASSQSSYGSMSGNEDLYLKQDLMTAVCENSYESSEDTGVGGLSENELMSNDVIGNFDMESCAELSKVLSSLPSNTLDDLLTEPLHASRDDEEYLDRAIEEVSASGMDQIAITAFEHLEGLDMLEMLDDDEQRQMISAATNLISMSGYLSHDQDNYSAMPSPMMS